MWDKYLCSIGIIFEKWIPIILLLISCYLLSSKKNLLIIFIMGYIFNLIFNLILKGIIQQPRPNENSRLFNLELLNIKRCDNKLKRIGYDRYGMPSGHAQLFFYISSFMAFALKNINISIFYFGISLLTIRQRVIFLQHTILQVFIGSGIGILMGYLFYKYGDKLITGIIRRKIDDNGPI